MFKVEPHYKFESKDVDLPKCMFKMDKIVGKEGVSLPGQGGTNVSMKRIELLVVTLLMRPGTREILISLNNYRLAQNHVISGSEI